MTVKNGDGVNLAADVCPPGDEEFDPIKDLLAAQSVKPAHLGEINLRALTPFQRALLVIDGTVTKFIEAYTMEPVEVVRLGQAARRLPDDHLWLEAAKGAEVLARQVILRGKFNYQLYAYARSLIVLDRLSDDVQRQLEIDGGGLGRILLSSRLETYREILWYGRENYQGWPDALRHLAGAEVISRTYRILSGGRPIMLINEKFPSFEDRLPAHH